MSDVLLDGWDRDLRCVTLTQPSCSAIRDADKDIENRPNHYKTLLRVGRGGRWLVFRAGGKKDSQAKLDQGNWDEKWPDMPDRKEWPKGVALVLVHVGNVVPLGDPLVRNNKWATGKWCWMLDRRIPLDPIQCDEEGGLGPRKCSRQLVNAIRQQLEAKGLIAAAPAVVAAPAAEAAALGAADVASKKRKSWSNDEDVPIKKSKSDDSDSE